MHWLDRTAPHLGLRPWLRPSLDGALEAWDAERGLDMLARMRWAVQADYVAQRVRDSDLTGIDRQAHNEKGLEDARRALAAYAP